MINLSLVEYARSSLAEGSFHDSHSLHLFLVLITVCSDLMVRHKRLVHPSQPSPIDEQDESGRGQRHMAPQVASVPTGYSRATVNLQNPMPWTELSLSEPENSWGNPVIANSNAQQLDSFAQVWLWNTSNDGQCMLNVNLSRTRYRIR